MAVLGPVYSFSSSSMNQPRKFHLERRIRLHEHELHTLGDDESALRPRNELTRTSSLQQPLTATSSITASMPPEVPVAHANGIAEPSAVATAAAGAAAVAAPTVQSSQLAALPPSAAAQWHVERRRAILSKYPEVHRRSTENFDRWPTKTVLLSLSNTPFVMLLVSFHEIYFIERNAS